jgi:phosphoribosylformylglycinamidine synthase
LPGGFSYGDYLRCGAIARFSPIMRAVVDEARAGKLRHRNLQWFSDSLRSGPSSGRTGAQSLTPFCLRHGDDAGRGGRFAFHSRVAGRGAASGLPVAHGEGCYYADEETLRELNEQRQIILRYCDARGEMFQRRTLTARSKTSPASAIARAMSSGLMPHPDRACEERLGSSDGARIFESMLRSLSDDRAAA